MLKRAYILILVLVLTGCTTNTPEDMGMEEVEPVFEQDVETVVLEDVADVTIDEDIVTEETTLEEIDAVETIAEVEVVEVDYEALGVNEVGHIMVVMYHGIKDNPPYHRTAEDFWKDLQYMYDNGYRLISMRDYVDNNISVEAGYTPIVLTFDDGLSSTFSLEQVDGELSVVKDSAIGIIEAFCEEHPDFGKAATLYINGYKASTFMGDGTYEEKLQWLVDNGYDIGNHTVTHSKLNTLTSEGVQYELATIDLMIKEAVGEAYIVDTLTYPHGIRPAEESREYVVNGEYEGHEYNYVIGFREGPSGPYYAPIDTKFDPYNCPRVRGSEGADGDLWWYFDYYDDHSNYLYVSDGNKDTVVIPEDRLERVDTEKTEDKEIIVY